jgi:hypothetical protein
MRHGKAEEFRITEARHQLDAARLVVYVLGVLKAKVEECALVLRQFGVEAAHDRAIRSCTGLGVRRKGPRRAAEHVARELIEGDDGGYRRFSMPQAIPYDQKTGTT